MSNDETRHYLNGIFIHITKSDTRSYLTGVATDDTDFHQVVSRLKI